MTTATREGVKIRPTKVYDAILQAMKDSKKGILLEGGTYSSKTYSALQALISVAAESRERLDISIVSESIPHLKGGCLKDFFKIMDQPTDKNPWYNMTDHIYSRPDWNGIITFLSADNMKALGMRRDFLFINEGDTLSWETAKELISRTNRFVIIDWNPRCEFWAHEYYKDDPKWAYDHSTYMDALRVIPPGKREDIEDLGMKDPNYHNVYELGLMGKIEGLVHPIFKQVDEMPDYPKIYGLDYGAASDPTVLTEHCFIGDKLYSHEMFYDYDPEITNNKISMKMQLLKVSRAAPIYPDPDEPKSANELRELGWNICETIKGKGSVKFGIKAVNNYWQHWTKDSLNCIKDQRNYRWIKNKETGLFTEETTHQWSHGPDSRRYPVASHNPQGVGRKSKRSNVW